MLVFFSARKVFQKKNHFRLNINQFPFVLSIGLHGHRECVEYLLKNSTEKDAVDHLGLTPYDYASKSGQVDIMNLLIKHGVQPSTNNNIE